MTSQHRHLGVNFINIIRTNFLCERRFSSYFLALSKHWYEKCERIMLMKLTVGGISNLKFLMRAWCYLYYFGFQLIRPIKVTLNDAIADIEGQMQ